MPDEYKDIEIGKLRLDSENPRLPRDMGDEDLLHRFYRTYNLVELARSMADKGFAPRQAEALLVVEDPPESDTYVVIEGNRRLATMILLDDAGRREELGLTTEWAALAAEAKENGHEFKEVPVIVHETREDLAEYLGFRHITGPTQWRPEAKARFIASLLGDGIRSIDEVWRAIGSNAHTVRRYAEAHAVYEQLLERGVDSEPIEAKFGVFYNALDKPGVRFYLRLGDKRDFDDLPQSPVPTDRLEELEALISLLYGDTANKVVKVIVESRELKELSQVLGHEEATKILLDTRDLQRAYRVAGGGKTELLALLKDSHARLVEANGKAYEFKNDDDVLLLVNNLVALVKDMEERYEIEADE